MTSGNRQIANLTSANLQQLINKNILHLPQSVTATQNITAPAAETSSDSESCFRDTSVVSSSQNTIKMQDDWLLHIIMLYLSQCVFYVHRLF